MKKLLIVSLFVVLITCIWAEYMQSFYKNTEEVLRPKKPKIYEESNREIPDWHFAIDPVGIITNYYDYMPGSYNSIPIHVQTTSNGGVYMVFHGCETAGSTRRIYYAYVDGDGNVTNSATIGTEDLHEGYPGIDLDPVSGDPIVAWHVNIDESTADEEVVVSYDLYHLGSPGLWKTPFIVIDDDISSPNAPNDVFVWPYVYVGPSPVAGKRRIYVIASNNDASPITGDPSENNLIAYADFDENDFNVQSELDWTYRTIPMLDEWHSGVPEWVRPTHAVALDEYGTVALFGYTVTEDATANMADKLYAFVNTNYGEGEFVYQESSCHYDVDNPMNQDGTYRFLDPDTGLPHDIYFAPYLCNHQNVIMQDDCLYFLGNVNMLIYPDSWYPDLPMMYPKMYKYDIADNDFSFQDMFITGANPNDDNVMLPWDLDEDGEVDQYDPDGYVTWVDGWPIYHYDNNVAFDENHWQITQNEDNNWLVAVWSEGLKSRLGNIPEPGYEDWAEFPEIAIAVSKDGGDSWSETILMNAKADDDNYAPELDGMIPVYIYTGDIIEDMGNGWGRLHLMFLDDNSYGSTIAGHGENLGGTMMYAAIDINFTFNDNDPVLIVPNAALDQNYPNPFNPDTTIKYNLETAANVALEIFNVKGQKVKTLVQEHQNAGEYQVTWHGKDDNSRAVSSGIYYYKMKSGNYVTTKKMILLK